MSNSWVLCKVTKATDEWLVKARMAGRLVYMPHAPTTRFCDTFRKEESATGPRRSMEFGFLYYNAGPYRPCDGMEVE